MLVLALHQAPPRRYELLPRRRPQVVEHTAPPHHDLHPSGLVLWITDLARRFLEQDVEEGALEGSARYLAR